MNTKISEIADKSACVAWCPIRGYADVIAVGTKDSGGVTGFEDTGGGLELYAYSETGSSESKLLGSIKTSARFASIAWSPHQGESSSYLLGVIAVGMADGTILIFDPNEIMGNNYDDLGSSLLGSVKQNATTLTANAPVSAMQFSSLESYKMCVGSTNGTVGIIDMSTMSNISSMEPATRNTPSTAAVTSVAWNTAVAHIVATSAADGVVTVWDLNARKIWCELRAEQHGQFVSDIQWNPSQGLHMLTASGDDRNPVIRVWDLSASTSMPLATLSGHRAGILKTSWCPHDDALLLSCGKDNRTILWDLYSLQPIAELSTDTIGKVAQVSANVTVPNNPGALFAAGAGASAGGLSGQKHMRYDVQWSPLKRGLAVTCSLDRKVQIHTVLALATKSGRPPAWMKPASSVSFGFGGSIISTFKNPDQTDTRKFVLLRSIQENPRLAQSSQELENDLLQNSMINFCHNQQIRSEGHEDEQLWAFMRLVFETNMRQKLLELLGYNAEDIATAAAQLDGQGLVVGGENEEATTSVTMNEAAKEIVKRALIIGNYQAAVECCFQHGNLVDALVLASCGGSELWSQTQERFFESESRKRPYLSMVKGVIRGQLDEFVNESNPSNWRETLAFLATYAQADDFSHLCLRLGDRLQHAGDEINASLCYVCALNLEHAIKRWKTQLDAATSVALIDKDSTKECDLLALQDFIVKISVFVQATTPVSTTLPEEVEELFTKYAQALADNGLFGTAARYVRGSSSRAKMLRDRLYRSCASGRCLQVLGAPPEFPFQMVAVEQSQGQVFVNSKDVAISHLVVANGIGHSAAQRLDDSSHFDTVQQSGFQQNAYSGQPQLSNSEHQQTYGVTSEGTYTSNQALSTQSKYEAYSSSQQSHAIDQLPPGWIALLDPNSGMTYYANQTTGETTWNKPEFVQPTTSVAQIQHQDSGLDTASRPKSKAAVLVSKYGDGFVTSASHPELADQYGNIGTSNPYTGVERPGIARAQPDDRKAPISGNLNFESLQLTENQQSVKDSLLGIVERLHQSHLNPVEKRQISEAEKSVAVLVKKLARNAVPDDSVQKVQQLVTFLVGRDYHSATSIQTQLANSEWRDHKDWLKGIKILITLASKKL